MSFNSLHDYSPLPVIESFMVVHDGIRKWTAYTSSSYFSLGETLLSLHCGQSVPSVTSTDNFVLCVPIFPPPFLSLSSTHSHIVTHTLCFLVSEAPDKRGRGHTGAVFILYTHTHTNPLEAIFKSSQPCALSFLPCLRRVEAGGGEGGGVRVLPLSSPLSYQYQMTLSLPRPPP